MAETNTTVRIINNKGLIHLDKKVSPWTFHSEYMSDILDQSVDVISLNRRTLVYT